MDCSFEKRLYAGCVLMMIILLLSRSRNIHCTHYGIKRAFQVKGGQRPYFMNNEGRCL